jgi:hypothetical protein
VRSAAAGDAANMRLLGRNGLVGRAFKVKRLTHAALLRPAIDALRNGHSPWILPASDKADFGATSNVE